jgi:hypothetical protein
VIARRKHFWQRVELAVGVAGVRFGQRFSMKRWIVNVGVGVVVAAASVLGFVGIVGWPKDWVGSSMSTLGYALLATVFVPGLVRAWVGKDSYEHRVGDAVVMLLINLAVIAAVLWAVEALPRAVLLVALVVGIQAVFTRQAWRRARVHGHAETPAG